jgi:hypothetical protein
MVKQHRMAKKQRLWVVRGAGQSGRYWGLVSPFLFCLILLTTGCSSESQPQVVNPIAKASAFLQGGDLYARAGLNPEFSKHIISALHHGEPMQATYHFSFYRHQEYLPDLPLAKVTIKRRLRLRLVTERYEMHDLNSDQIHYTEDKDKAISFFSNPRFVLLGKNAHLKKEHSYWLNIDFEIDHKGMSPMFRTLKQWLTFDRGRDYKFSVDFKQS